MNASQSKAISQLIASFHPSWISIAMWVILIGFLAYFRYIQIQNRKIREIRKTERETKNSEMLKILEIRDKQLLEMTEQFNALEDVLQSTQEQMELLDISGEIDQQVLELLYHATTHSSEVPILERGT